MYSNLYAWDVISSDSSFILYGFDEDIITQELGVSETDAISGRGVKVNGYRIVQPHEEVLNTLLSEGVLFTIAYYLIISWIISKLLTQESLGFFIAYFIGSLFMHGMFSYSYLLQFIFTVIILNSISSQGYRNWHYLKTLSNSQRIRGIKDRGFEMRETMRFDELTSGDTKVELIGNDRLGYFVERLFL
jgi:hypothetical protein